MEIFLAVLVPFWGTSAGAACVFFLKNAQNLRIRQWLSAFSAGVMTAACIWSLLLPALARSEHLENWAFLPALLGIWCGIFGMQLADTFFPETAEGADLLVFSVTAHNLPEGMAVGAAAAGYLTGLPGCNLVGVMALAVGIALQNFPEGAIISLPLHSKGMSRSRSFVWGALSGAVEPLGAVLTLLLAELIVPVLPFFLSWSAGAMLYVVVEELLPAPRTQKNILPFAAGFSVMMLLDVLLG